MADPDLVGEATAFTAIAKKLTIPEMKATIPSEKTNRVKSLRLTPTAPYVQVFEARVADNAAEDDQ